MVSVIRSTFSVPFPLLPTKGDSILRSDRCNSDANVWTGKLTASLSAGFCVWLCHPEAAFLSGKVLWAQWDVPELLAQKEWIEKHPWHLEIGLNLPSTERPTEDFFVVDTRVKG